MAPLDQNAKDKVELGTQRLPILLPGLLVTKGTMCDKELTDGGFYSIDLKKKMFAGTETRPEYGHGEGPGKRGSAELPVGPIHSWSLRAQQISWLIYMIRIDSHCKGMTPSNLAGFWGRCLPVDTFIYFF